MNGRRGAAKIISRGDVKFETKIRYTNVHKIDSYNSSNKPFPELLVSPEGIENCWMEFVTRGIAGIVGSTVRSR